MSKTKKGQLSRSYRFKKKSGIVKKRSENNDLQSQSKKGRIIIRNLPFKVSETDIKNFYKPFGEIEEINLLKRPDGKLVGCGFVQFKNVEDASKAIFQTNKTNFLGRTISSEWAIPKTEFYGTVKSESKPNEVKYESEENPSVEENDDETPKEVKTNLKNKNTLSKAEQRKLQKLKTRKKRSRIVIRNLPFTVNDDLLKEKFIKYGNIEEINILKKQNGCPTGVCFLQFERVQSAAQAIHYENMQSVSGRPMVVDWAIPKDKFLKSTEFKTEIKEEKEDCIHSELKEDEKKNSNENEVKKEDESSREENTDDEEDDHHLNNQDYSNYDEKNVKVESVDEGRSQHPRISNDVTEGKTVFIKNIPFRSTNEDLKYLMEHFGPVHYALICIDRLTEHSKGTAFVKFRNVEDAEKCLAAGTELKLNDQILDPLRALQRNELNEKNEEKTKKEKDSRNLYLVKEGVILASSPAARDVSASDMAKRLQLEKWKSQMLRNLGMFVSKVRLVVHNLPPSLDDSKLRQIFKNHSNPKAVITEARVMRDLRNLDSDGIGKSKEYGFVCFTSHDDALKALRSVNNNPAIFSKTHRPIVAFSIENRIMVNAKQKRLEKSRQCNPLYGKRPQNESVENCHQILDPLRALNRNEISKKNEEKTKEKKDSRNLNLGKKKFDADESNFSQLVSNYKNKLSSAVRQKSKWYET